MTKMGTYGTYPERILQNITSRVLGSVYDSSSAMSMFRLRSWVVSWWFPGVCCCLFAVSNLSWDALCISPSEGHVWAKNSQFNIQSKLASFCFLFVSALMIPSKQTTFLATQMILWQDKKVEGCLLSVSRDQASSRNIFMDTDSVLCFPYYWFSGNKNKFECMKKNYTICQIILSTK